MGFYVDLEMPKDCPMCPFANYDMFNTFKGCDITRGKRWAVKDDKDYAKSSTRPDWCPLIEVPEPHGRLIDADALDKMLKFIGEAEAQIYGRNSWGFVNKCRQALCDAPTVIPAEEETCTKN